MLVNESNVYIGLLYYA